MPICLDSLRILHVQERFIAGDACSLCHFKHFCHTIVHSHPENRRHENRDIRKFCGVLMRKHWKEPERKKRILRNSCVSIETGLFRDSSNAPHVTHVSLILLSLEDVRPSRVVTRHNDGEGNVTHRFQIMFSYILPLGLLLWVFEIAFFSCSIIANVWPNNGHSVWLSTTTITCLGFVCVMFKKWETIVQGGLAAMFDLWKDFTKHCQAPPQQLEGKCRYTGASHFRLTFKLAPWRYQTTSYPKEFYSSTLKPEEQGSAKNRNVDVEEEKRN